jgi:xylulokinase
MHGEDGRVLALGLDVGTTGLKGLLVDADGRIVAEATASYAPDAPHPGWSQQDATVWAAASDDVCRRLAPHGAPAAIGLSGQMHGSVFLDAEGVPVAPAILWNDQRTAAECDEIIARTAGRIVEWTLNPPRTAFTASKILWLRNHDADAWRRTATVLLPKDLVRFHLTGERISDVTDASGTNLLDVRARRWSHETLDALDLPASCLPALVESPEPAGRLSARAAAAIGLPAGIPFVGGAADQPAAAIGNGVVEPGTVSITLGTSGVVYAQIPGVIVDPSGAFHTFCHSVPGTWQVMAGVLSAAGSLQWWRETGGAADADAAEAAGASGFGAIVEAARAVPPGSGGLVFLPYRTGERSPHNAPEARGAFIGLTRRTTRAHMARAVMEGVAFALRDLVELLATLDLPIREIRVAGGGVRGGLWLAILASVLNRPVVPATTPDASAYGAAMLAMAHASGRDIVSLARAWIRPGAPVLPDPEAAAAYGRVYAVFRSLYPATREAAHTLGAIDRAVSSLEHAA